MGFPYTILGLVVGVIGLGTGAALASAAGH